MEKGEGNAVEMVGRDNRTLPSRIAPTIRSHDGRADGLTLSKLSSSIRKALGRRRVSKVAASEDVDRNLHTVST